MLNLNAWESRTDRTSTLTIAAPYEGIDTKTLRSFIASCSKVVIPLMLVPLLPLTASAAFVSLRRRFGVHLSSGTSTSASPSLAPSRARRKSTLTPSTLTLSFSTSSNRTAAALCPCFSFRPRMRLVPIKSRKAEATKESKEFPRLSQVPRA